jgi:thiamine-monophosphate kinase
MKPPTLAALGEFGFISHLTSSVKNGHGVITGIGDDAAVTALTPGMQLLTSTDMLLEDVHFRRSWHPPYLLGRKSLAVNLSDIAAMGGIPRWTTLSLAIPKDMPLEFLQQFAAGFLAMASEHDVTLIGGDTCSSKTGLAISVTIMGEQLPERIARRSGAQPGDEIWVTGTLGDAATALKLLEDTSSKANHEALVSRLLNPSPRMTAGRALAESGLVTAMIDISDGIISDFGHIAEMSGVGGELYLQRLPLSGALREYCKGNAGAIPWHMALAGGEDYELCFTAAPQQHEKITSLVKNSGINATAVGIVVDSQSVIALDENGELFDCATTGFNHFS